jgi:hypothetical protein
MPVHDSQKEFDLTTFSGCMNKQMQELGVSLRDLEKYTEMTYEHVRRLAKGDARPSRPMLKMVCDCLQLDFNHMQWLLASEKVRAKYGQPIERLLGKHPDLVLLQQTWPMLSQEHRGKLLNLAQELAEDALEERTSKQLAEAVQ